MSTHNRILMVGAAGLLLSALPILAKAPQKLKPKAVPAETAVIENTGSTNTGGYRITLSSAGGVTVEGRAVALPPDMSAQLVRHSAQLFRDLAAAMPLSGLRARHGMRSASFGTRTFITYKGQQSPDLTFGGDARASALEADIAAITGVLHIGPTPRRSVPVGPIVQVAPAP